MKRSRSPSPAQISRSVRFPSPRKNGIKTKGSILKLVFPSKSATDLSDTFNIGWLLLLYTLQGVPLGMSQVFPLLLKERGASYSEIALFALTSWPFALKLLWAPLVDSVYVEVWGRRKSWLIPSQLLIAAVMVYVANNFEVWLENDMVGFLTAAFFVLYFLAATQDIAVDGWALTMLSPKAVGWAGTCNAIGQNLGFFLAFSGFMFLETYNLCSLSDFMHFWSVVFLVVTVMVALFKREGPSELSKDETPAVVYGQMMQMAKIVPIQKLAIFLLIFKIPFGVTDSVTSLRFQELGLSKEMMASLTTVAVPLGIVVPVLVNKLIAKGPPFATILNLLIPRTCMAFVASGLVYYLMSANGGGPKGRKPAQEKNMLER